MEICENCGATIGKLETPMVWKESVVCAACHAKLSAASPVAIAYATPTPASSATPHVLGPDDIICPNPNCGYRGPANKEAKGSTAMLILLLLFWIIPGLIYMIVYNGYVLLCPKCGVKIRDA